MILVSDSTDNLLALTVESKKLFSFVIGCIFKPMFLAKLLFGFGDLNIILGRLISFWSSIFVKALGLELLNGLFLVYDS